MSLSDYLKGPQHKARSVQLEAELTGVRDRCASLDADLSGLKERYGQLQDLAKKYGAMEMAEVLREIAEERRTLASMKEAVVQAKHEADAVAL